MKLELKQPSANSVSSWTWSVSFNEDIDGSGYAIHLEKGHPVWEAFCQWVSICTPKWVRRAFFGSDLYERLRFKYVMDVMDLSLEDWQAMALARPMWEVCTGPDAIEDDEFSDWDDED